jgi:hypothetical protein
MAVKKSSAGLLFVRLLGLTGLFVAAGGALVWVAFDDERFRQFGLNAVWGGLGALGVALLCELPALFGMMTSRRGAVGGSVVVQVALAIALALGVNIFAFEHFTRFDLTRYQIFTLRPELRDQLAKLRGETDIVVVRRKLSSEFVDDAPSDRFDVAAPKKIIEKVNDLAQQFSDLGPRFRVQVLDINDDDFDRKLRAIREAEHELAKKNKKEKSSPLADEIEKYSKQNSIFFKSGDKVQRLAFHDVYQIDKKESMELWSLPALSVSLTGLMTTPSGQGPLLAAATLNTGRDGLREGRGNLVLNFQGIEPFARKILNIEEKVPKLSVAVVHPVLSMSNQEVPDYSLAGARKLLQARGFETKDIMLRKQDIEDDLSPEPAAETFDENRFEQIEEILPRLDEAIKETQEAYVETKKMLDFWTTQPLTELQKKYIYVILPNGQEGLVPLATIAELDKEKRKYKTLPVDEEDRASRVGLYTLRSKDIERALEEGRKQRDELSKERATLSVDDIAERRRIADVEAKMNRMLADADVLVIPRITLQKIIINRAIPNWVHKLDEAQLKAIKSFMMKGKPVLFLLGPANERPGRQIPPQFGAGEDKLEPLLAELGVKLPKQTILYNVEAKEFTERKRAFGGGERELKLPPVLVDWAAGEGRIKKRADEAVKRLSKLKKQLDEAQAEFDAAKGTVEAKTKLDEAKKAYDAEKTLIDAAPRHPIRDSLSILSRAVGKSLAEDLQIRYPRPVYVAADLTSPAGFDESAVFLMAAPESWNENNPFPNEKREPPRFTPAKEDDKLKGDGEGGKAEVAYDDVRRGPFPIGVALEPTLPKSWFGDKEPTKVRIAVIGSGDVFAGNALNPIKEKLLLDVCNWLLGRDDLLAKQHESWSFPRVELSDAEMKIWHWGAFIGLPIAFLYLGLGVWLVRRMR